MVEQLTSVTYRNTVTGKEEWLAAPYFIDATEAGDLLPLAAVGLCNRRRSQSRYT